MQHVTLIKTQLGSNDSVLEAELWSALGMDDLEKQMAGETFTAGSRLMMGTGHTVNACFMCASSSATTAGCQTCC